MKPDEPVRGIRMLRVSEISARTSLSRSQLYKLLDRRVLPPLVHIGSRARGLPEHVVDDWLESRIAQRTTTVPVRRAGHSPASVSRFDASAARPGIRMLRLAQVESRVGLKKTQIYRNINDGRFPAPVPLCQRARRWVEPEIDQWLKDRMARLLRLRRRDRWW